MLPITGSALVSCVATVALVMGVVELIAAFGSGDWGSSIFAALSIIVSLLLFANLFAVTVALPYVLAVFVILSGMSAIGFSFHLLRKRRRGRYPRLLVSLPSTETP